MYHNGLNEHKIISAPEIEMQIIKPIFKYKNGMINGKLLQKKDKWLMTEKQMWMKQIEGAKKQR